MSSISRSNSLDGSSPIGPSPEGHTAAGAEKTVSQLRAEYLARNAPPATQIINHVAPPTIQGMGHVVHHQDQLNLDQYTFSDSPRGSLSFAGGMSSASKMALPILRGDNHHSSFSGLFPARDRSLSVSYLTPGINAPQGTIHVMELESDEDEETENDPLLDSQDNSGADLTLVMSDDEESINADKVVLTPPPSPISSVIKSFDVEQEFVVEEVGSKDPGELEVVLHEQIPAGPIDLKAIEKIGEGKSQDVSISTQRILNDMIAEMKKQGASKGNFKLEHSMQKEPFQVEVFMKGNQKFYKSDITYTIIAPPNGPKANLTRTIYSSSKDIKSATAALINYSKTVCALAVMEKDPTSDTYTSSLFSNSFGTADYNKLMDQISFSCTFRKDAKGTPVTATQIQGGNFKLLFNENKEKKKVVTEKGAELLHYDDDMRFAKIQRPATSKTLNESGKSVKDYVKTYQADFAKEAAKFEEAKKIFTSSRFFNLIKGDTSELNSLVKVLDEKGKLSPEHHETLAHFGSMDTNLENMKEIRGQLVRLKKDLLANDKDRSGAKEGLLATKTNAQIIQGQINSMDAAIQKATEFMKIIEGKIGKIRREDKQSSAMVAAKPDELHEMDASEVEFFLEED